VTIAAGPLAGSAVVRRRGAPSEPELEVLAQEAGVHPEIVRRLLRLGLLDDSLHGAFPPDASARIARATRLRHDLGLSYAGALLACQLLERIELLERRGR
jgi:hypothetical protein